MAEKTYDSRFVRHCAVAYLTGKGLSWGVGPSPILPHAAQDLGRFSISGDFAPNPGTAFCDSNLDVIANKSLDHVFIGPRLKTGDDRILAEAVSKLKIGGHLVVHTIDPQMDLRPALAGLALWQEKDVYRRNEQYLGVWKLEGLGQREVRPPKPKAAKRACIVRYGAIGDMIMVSPLIRQLATDGYEVTLNVTPYCAEVIRHNPYVSNIIIQEREAIPNPELGPYWEEWAAQYEKYINLSESIEGKLLKVEGRRDYYTTKAWREEICGSTNYVDQTMSLGGYPELKGCKPELYFSSAERKAAKFVREKFKDNFLILWSLRGSSHHKTYPLLEPTLREWLEDYPKARVMLTGAPQDKPLGFENSQVLNTCGEMPLREVLALTEVVDLVAGPESAVVNAASCFSTPKMALLSHSNLHNLCAYWENNFSLAPTNIPCYPCHQLHYTRDGCPTVQIRDSSVPESDPAFQIWEGPACAGAGVRPERLKSRLSEIYSRWQSML